jgi:hypothetical protein
VNSEYADTRPIYMPPVAKELFNSIKSEKEREFDILALRSAKRANVN